MSTRGVLLVGALPPPHGGVATHVRRLERALASRGVDVRAIDPRRHGPDGRDGRPRLAGWYDRFASRPGATAPRKPR